MAAYFGLEQDDVKDMAPAKLSAMLWKMHRQQDAMRQQLLTERTIQDSQTKPLPPEPQPDPDDLRLSDETADALTPEIAGYLRGLAKQNKELRDQVKDLVGREKRREAKTAQDIYDNAFSALGPEYDQFFGSQPASELQRGSPEMIRRINILGQAGVNLEADSQQTVSRKVKAIASAIYGPLIDKNKKPPLQDAGPYGEPAPSGKKTAQRITQEQWDDAGLQRPASRKVDDLPQGEERAQRNLAAKLGTAHQSDAEEMNGFPD